MSAIRIPAPDPETPQQAIDRALEAAKQGNLALAGGILADVLASDPDNRLALVNLGAIHCHTGQLDRGTDLLRRAFDLAPDDRHARANFRGAAGLLADAKRAAGDFAASVPPLRDVIALDPADTAGRVNLIDSLFRSGQRARLEDFAPGLAPETLGKKLFIACMPKSGSSWLLNTLMTLTGFPRSTLVFSFLQNEQELYLPELVARARENGVVQQHCRATAANVQLMQAFGIRPVVLVRNLFDTVVSLTDFFAAGATVNTFFYRDFPTFDRPRQIDLVVDHVVPWYLQFFASWAIAEAEGRLDIVWLRYRDMMADKKAAIALLNDYYDLGKAAGDIDAVLARVEGDTVANRFNKGVVGRGESELTDEQKDRIRGQMSYFPSIGFERVGL